MKTPKQVTVSLWPNTQALIDGVIEAHHAWLERMRQSQYASDRESVKGLDDWTPADVINNALQDGCPLLIEQYRR